MARAAKSRFRRYRQLGVFSTVVAITLFDFTFQFDTILVSRSTLKVTCAGFAPDVTIKDTFAA